MKAFRQMKVRHIGILWLGLIILYSIGLIALIIQSVQNQFVFDLSIWTIVFFALVVSYVAVSFVTTELFAEYVIGLRYPFLINTCAQKELRMVPHIFTHFVPSNTFADIEDHFRVTFKEVNSPSDKTMYLAGDCTLFEGHLIPQQSVAYQLEKSLKGIKVLNAGVPHYTALHSYNRMVFDIVRGYKPEMIVLFTGVNDVLSFIHHKNGFHDPTHLHLFKPWLQYGCLHRKVASIPSYIAKVLFAYRVVGRDGHNWERQAEIMSDTYSQADSVKKARELFNTDSFMKCLQLFNGTCNSIGARLILTTYYYNHEDMHEEPRKTYAWGVDMLNDAIRKFSQAEKIELIDLANELVLLSGSDIKNKWHYTSNGNKKRAVLLGKRLAEICQLE